MLKRSKTFVTAETGNFLKFDRNSFKRYLLRVFPLTLEQILPIIKGILEKRLLQYTKFYYWPCSGRWNVLEFNRSFFGKAMQKSFPKAFSWIFQKSNMYDGALYKNSYGHTFFIVRKSPFFMGSIFCSSIALV